MNQTRRPARRTDAERNRDKIMKVARAAFADPGAEVSMAEISRRADVGMATLYRNFPGRRELLEALYSEEVDAICKATEAPDGQAPGVSLEYWLRQLLVFFASKRHISSELLKHTDSSDPVFGGGRSAGPHRTGSPPRSPAPRPAPPAPPDTAAPSRRSPRAPGPPPRQARA
jgi:AcrR family transcriptional regulator